jgi:hypothetical protein
LNRIAIAIIVALVIGVAYASISLYLFAVLDYKSQAAPAAVSSFSFVTSACVLRDLSRFRDTELGRLKHERASLVIGLIFVCMYVPISVGSTFLEAFKDSAKLVERYSERSRQPPEKSEKAVDIPRGSATPSGSGD